MIDLYYWTTPNGHKITLFLEETGLPYTVKPINIAKNEQFDPNFLVIAPNNRIPAIVDHEPSDGGEPISVFESGAILLHLAEKTGQFLSTEPRVRLQTLEWLFWQMGGLGPMAGQNHHFGQFAKEKFPMRSLATSMRRHVYTGCSIDAWLIARSLPMTIRLRIWLVFRGLLPIRDSNKTWPTFLICSAGIGRFTSVRQPSGLINSVRR